MCFAVIPYQCRTCWAVQVNEHREFKTTREFRDFTLGARLSPLWLKTGPVVGHYKLGLHNIMWKFSKLQFKL